MDSSSRRLGSDTTIGTPPGDGAGAADPSGPSSNERTVRLWIATATERATGLREPLSRRPETGDGPALLLDRRVLAGSLGRWLCMPAMVGVSRTEVARSLPSGTPTTNPQRPHLTSFLAPGHMRSRAMRRTHPRGARTETGLSLHLLYLGLPSGTRGARHGTARPEHSSADQEREGRRGQSGTARGLVGFLTPRDPYDCSHRGPGRRQRTKPGSLRRWPRCHLSPPAIAAPRCAPSQPRVRRPRPTQRSERWRRAGRADRAARPSEPSRSGQLGAPSTRSGQGQDPLPDKLSAKREPGRQAPNPTSAVGPGSWWCLGRGREGNPALFLKQAGGRSRVVPTKPLADHWGCRQDSLRVLAALDETQGRQDAHVLASGAFGAPRTEGPSGDRGATGRA